MSTPQTTSTTAGHLIVAQLERAGIQRVYGVPGESFLDVLDAERSTYSAQDTLIQSRVLLTTYYIALQKALGGGWNGKVDTGTPEVVDTNTGPHFKKSEERPAS